MSRALSAIMLLTAAGLASFSAFAVTPRQSATAILKREGFSAPFIRELDSAYDPETSQKVVNLKLMGFLKKGRYEGHFSGVAVRKIAAYLAKHKAAFARAQKQTGVPPSIVASLLWVETKHGRTLGSYRIADALYSLLEAEHPERLEGAYRELLTLKPDLSKVEEDAIKAKIRLRAKERVEFALKELRALEKIRDRYGKAAVKVRGSYAGAFGIPQFLPSSYLAWAKSSKAGRPSNLFTHEDAILSVAHYLKANGWTGSPQSRQAALFHYNRAQGYVDVIQKLSAAASPSRTDRGVASVPKSPNGRK